MMLSFYLVTSFKNGTYLFKFSVILSDFLYMWNIFKDTRGRHVKKISLVTILTSYTKEYFFAYYSNWKHKNTITMPQIL